MIKSIKAVAAAALIAAVPFSVQADSHKGGVEEVLVILSSDSLQTQGMAMVLSNLALKSYEAPALKPKNVTPGQMLRGLLKNGGDAKVCALYLPNSEYSKDDLIDGVGVAMPPEMAGQMLNPKMRTFTF